MKKACIYYRPTYASAYARQGKLVNGQNLSSTARHFRVQYIIKLEANKMSLIRKKFDFLLETWLNNWLYNPPIHQAWSMTVYFTKQKFVTCPFKDPWPQAPSGHYSFVIHMDNTCPFKDPWPQAPSGHYSFVIHMDNTCPFKDPWPQAPSGHYSFVIHMDNTCPFKDPCS